MLKQLFFITLMVVMLASCGDKKKEVAYLNNELTAINDSLFYKGGAWGEEFKIAYNTGDFSQLQPARMEIQQYIEAGIWKVNDMGDVGGSEKFRAAELEYLQFERDSIIAKMLPFEQFTSATSPQEVAIAYQALLNTSQQEQQKLQTLRRVQQAYAEKNKIQLRESSLSHIQ